MPRASPRATVQAQQGREVYRLGHQVVQLQGELAGAATRMLAEQQRSAALAGELAGERAAQGRLQEGLVAAQAAAAEAAARAQVRRMRHSSRRIRGFGVVAPGPPLTMRR